MGTRGGGGRFGSGRAETGLRCRALPARQSAGSVINGTAPCYRRQQAKPPPARSAALKNLASGAAHPAAVAPLPNASPPVCLPCPTHSLPRCPRPVAAEASAHPRLLQVEVSPHPPPPPPAPLQEEARPCLPPHLRRGETAPLPPPSQGDATAPPLHPPPPPPPPRPPSQAEATAPLPRRHRLQRQQSHQVKRGEAAPPAALAGTNPQLSRSRTGAAGKGLHGGAFGRTSTRSTCN